VEEVEARVPPRGRVGGPRGDSAGFVVHLWVDGALEAAPFPFVLTEKLYASESVLTTEGNAL
jgi:hypothetical protein